MINKIEHLAFRPLIGLASPHLQTILACYGQAGKPAPSISQLFTLEDGDKLCCEISTPLQWTPQQSTILLIHGLGGSHSSGYMIRLSRKFYQAGFRVVRINLRGCGSGKHHARRSYHGGLSDDVLQVVKTLKKQTPLSPFVLIGFSLGGNIALKLLGELGEEANEFLQHTFAVCAPLDIQNAVKRITQKTNHFYHRSFLKSMRQQCLSWSKNHHTPTLYDFDDMITAPQWGFKNGQDYYDQCSSQKFLSHIRHPCHLIFAADDPFIDYSPALNQPLSSDVKICVSQYGGHLGFLGWAGREHQIFWLDHLLMKLTKEAIGQ
jgi:predicted alpha/beta-fold hydrolase